MKAFQSSGAVIAGINLKLLGATCAGALAYALWPDAPQNFAFGIISVFLAALALSALIERRQVGGKTLPAR